MASFTKERRGRRGFTLIELLVVMAIVAMLIGILVPSIKAARRSGNASVCLAQLAQYGQAHHLYADRHREQFVPIHAGLEWPWIGDFAYREILGLPIDRAAAADGQINGGYMSLGDLGCPSVPPQFRDKGEHHYGMNLNLTRGGGELTVVRRSDVAHPSEKVQMTDASTFRVWWVLASPQFWDQYGESSPAGDEGTGTAVAYRHDETANVLHFDGHASTYDPARLFSWDPRERDRLWNIRR